jgi:hypothetical protein
MRGSVRAPRSSASRKAIISLHLTGSYRSSCKPIAVGAVGTADSP